MTTIDALPAPVLVTMYGIEPSGVVFPSYPSTVGLRSAVSSPDVATNSTTRP